jgi:hypothetical protein
MNIANWNQHLIDCGFPSGVIIVHEKYQNIVLPHFGKRHYRSFKIKKNFIIGDPLKLYGNSDNFYVMDLFGDGVMCGYQSKNNVWMVGSSTFVSGQKTPTIWEIEINKKIVGFYINTNLYH